MATNAVVNPNDHRHSISQLQNYKPRARKIVAV